MKREFDLFKLHIPEEDRTPRTWICAMGKRLQTKIDEIINEIVEKKSEKILYVRLQPNVIKEVYNKAITKAGSQKNLSQKLDIPRQNLYKWKESAHKIPYTVLLKLLKFAGIKYSFIEKFIIEKKFYQRGLTKDRIAKILCKKLNTTLNFTERIIYKMRKEVALIFIIELLKLWKDLLNKFKKEVESKKNEIQETFEFLKQNSGGRVYKVKAVKRLNSTLSTIVGAMLADGCVADALNFISILDEDRINLEAFSEWMRSVFKITPKVRKGKTSKAWYIKIDNKVIRRYFLVFFGFSSGKKHENYDVPLVIKKSTFEIQKACARGVMSFDGCVLMKKKVGINIGSKQLRDSLFKIFKKNDLIVSKSKKADATGMWRIYSSGESNNLQYQKWLDYFVKKSDRWYRICEWINGFQGRVSTEKETLLALKRCFPQKSNSKITLSLVFEIFLNNGNLTLKQILLILKKRNIKISESALWKYLGCLRNMNIISKRRMSDNTNIYVLNENVDEWRVPNRN